MRITVFTKGDLKQWLINAERRTSPRHLEWINRNICAKVIHAATTFNFIKEGRPKRWPPLGKYYKKWKEKQSWDKVENKQPVELGRYPTPWGNINIRTGKLFAELGTTLHITDKQVIYGVPTDYAMKVHKGSKAGTNYIVEYDRKTKSGVKHITSHRKTKKGVPPRPFDYISKKELDAMEIAINEYVTCPPNRRVIIIPDITPNEIRAPGGRRIYIAYVKNK